VGEESEVESARNKLNVKEEEDSSEEESEEESLCSRCAAAVRREMEKPIEMTDDEAMEGPVETTDDEAKEEPIETTDYEAKEEHKAAELDRAAMEVPSTQELVSQTDDEAKEEPKAAELDRAAIEVPSTQASESAAGCNSLLRGGEHRAYHQYRVPKAPAVGGPDSSDPRSAIVSQTDDEAKEEPTAAELDPAAIKVPSTQASEATTPARRGTQHRSLRGVPSTPTKAPQLDPAGEAIVSHKKGYHFTCDFLNQDDDETYQTESEKGGSKSSEVSFVDETYQIEREKVLEQYNFKARALGKSKGFGSRHLADKGF